ncbi:hypothetical protein [Flavobacterium xanthum]|uniref:Uncharacterized protein n=1 Tax=Flavobacterium xanthum TaxID=69322 RepID=A0A1M7LME2_9FLAO|nr:hypothetical protein [Flavobacterium xanthum]SHM79340.1 hypothetical protein SAMN05443669_10764 [Flavobacterium xanthum]
MKTKILKIVLNIFLILQSLSTYSQDYEPRGRYYPEDENIGLPSLGLAGKSLIIGAVLFIIGWIISKIKKDENGNSGSTFGGCLIMIGIICAIPALAWIQAIGASIYIIGVVVLVIIGILVYVWDKINDK